MNPTLHVRILSPQQTFFEGEILSVSSKNTQGAFDILPEHANFITVIENSPIVVRTQGQKPLTFLFPIAIIYTTENKVNIYTHNQLQNSQTFSK